MTSKKLGANSTSQKPNSLRRSRVLKRGKAWLEPIAEQHFPFAWAAYRRGVFNHIPDFPEGLDAAEFTARLADTALTVARMGGEVLVALADTSKGEIPLALVTVEYSDGKAFPHALWFPEASYRNKLELGLVLFIELKKQHLVLVTAKTPKGQKSSDVKFFEHLGKYGVLRRVGTIHGYFGPDQNAVLFQSVVANEQKRTQDIGLPQEPSGEIPGNSDPGVQPSEADAS